MACFFFAGFLGGAFAFPFAGFAFLVTGAGAGSAATSTGLARFQTKEIPKTHKKLSLVEWELGAGFALIVVPSLGHKFLPYSWGHYRPRPVEIIIVLSTFAAMTLLYALFSKFVPIISIWELKVGAHDVHETPLERAEHAVGELRP